MGRAWERKRRARGQRQLRSGGIEPATAEPAEPSSGSAAPPFSYQLADAYLYTCHAARRAVAEEDPEVPEFEVALSTQERNYGFDATLQVTVTFRFRAESVATLNVSTYGVFVGERLADAGAEDRFRTLDCAVLLWPYSRAHVGELARMMGLALPALPTIDVRSVLRGKPAAIEPEQPE